MKEELAQEVVSLHLSEREVEEVELKYKTFSCLKLSRLVHQETQANSQLEVEHIEATFFLLAKFFNWFSERLAAVNVSGVKINLREIDEYFAGCLELYGKLKQLRVANKRARAKKKELEELNNYLYLLTQGSFMKKYRRLTMQDLPSSASASSSSSSSSFSSASSIPSVAEDVFSPHTLITVEEGRTFWVDKFGAQTCIVPWLKFEQSLRQVSDLGGKPEEDVAHAMSRVAYTLDYMKTGSVSVYRFTEFMKVFSPLRSAISNVNSLLEKRWFSGYLPREESNKLLSAYPVGTFIIRFSRSSPGSFALSFVGDDKSIQQIKILVMEVNSGDGADQLRPRYCFQVDESGGKKKDFNTLQSIVDYYTEAGILRLPMCSEVTKLGCFFGDVSADDSKTLMAKEPAGTYLLRISSKPQHFAVTYVDPKCKDAQHMLVKVMGDDGGSFQLATQQGGAEPVFSSIEDLLRHYPAFVYPLKKFNVDLLEDEVSSSKPQQPGSGGSASASEEAYGAINTSRDRKHVASHYDVAGSPKSKDSDKKLKEEKKRLEKEKKEREKKEKERLKKEKKEKEKEKGKGKEKEKEKKGKRGSSVTGTATLIGSGLSDDSVLYVEDETSGKTLTANVGCLIDKLLIETSEFKDFFFISFTSFMTSNQFLNALKKKVTSPAINQTKDIIPGVLALLSQWANNYGEDIEGETLHQFCTTCTQLAELSSPPHKPAFLSLPNIIQKKKECIRQSRLDFVDLPPAPILPVVFSPCPLAAYQPFSFTSNVPLATSSSSDNIRRAGPVESISRLHLSQSQPQSQSLPTVLVQRKSPDVASPKHLSESSTHMPSSRTSGNLHKESGRPDPSTIEPDTPLFGNLQKTSIAPANSILHFLHPLEFARQLTLIEFDLFCKINLSRELVRNKLGTVQLPMSEGSPKEESINTSASSLLWTTSNKQTDSPNIMNLINHFNLISHWMSTQIVRQTDLKDRKNMMEFFIQVLANLRKQNNFYGMMIVLSSLNSSPISRLKKTWVLLSAESKRIFSEENDLFVPVSNYRAYKTALYSSPLPCLPFLGLYLTDLTFINDGNPTMVNGEINFRKCELIAKVISEMKLFQNVRYDFWPLNCYQLFLRSCSPASDEEIYQISKSLEPPLVKK